MRGGRSGHPALAAHRETRQRAAAMLLGPALRAEQRSCLRLFVTRGCREPRPAASQCAGLAPARRQPGPAARRV